MRGTAAIAMILLVALPGAGGAQVQVPDGFVDDVIQGGLAEPTSLAFLPDGRVLVIEQRTGNIRMIVNGQFSTMDPIFTVPDVESGFVEQGLLGITVDPDWPVLPYVYVMHDRVGGTMRIVRYLASDDVDDPNGQVLTLSAQRTLIDDIPDLQGVHNAGCLRFGPDGCLYASLGDDSYFCQAGDSTTLQGEILRLRVDQLPIYGGPQVRRALLTPPDNPFVASPDSNARLVYAYGMRNPFRFHVDPVIGDLFVADVGDQTVEEMDQVSPGDFLGWPWREGDVIRDRPACPEPGGPGTIAYRSPIATILQTDPIPYAIISAGVYRPVAGGAANWPTGYYALRGDVFYTQYYDGKVRRLSWDGAAWQPAGPVAGQPDPAYWATGLLSPTDFLVGPDGSLWWLSQFDASFSPSSGTLHRIRWVGPPTAVDPTSPSVRVLRARPNPSRSSTDLTFWLPAGGRVRLAVYDLGGRRVRLLEDGVRPAGESRVRWDGTDDAGQVTGAGVYFARLEREGARTETARLMRLR